MILPNFFGTFFSFLQKMFIFPYKIGFPPLFYFFTLLPFYLYHMSSAMFSRQPSVLVMLILLDGNEYREGKYYGQQEDNDAAAQDCRPSPSTTYPIPREYDRRHHESWHIWLLCSCLDTVNRVEMGISFLLRQRNRPDLPGWDTPSVSLIASNTFLPATLLTYPVVSILASATSS